MRQESNHRMSSGEKDSLKISNSRAMGVIVLIALLFLFQVVTFVVQKVRERQVGQVVERVPVEQNDAGGGADPGLGASVPVGSKLFTFNPNTITQDSLQLLGFSQKQAASIIKYRTKGGKFRVKRDFAKMYVVDSAKYAALAPFILLPDSLLVMKAAPGGASSGGASSGKGVTSSASGRRIVTNKPKNVTNRDKNVRIVTEMADSVTNDAKNTPIVTEPPKNVTAPLPQAAPPQAATQQPASKYGTRAPKEKYVCNLNSADSAALVELYGIGGYYARKILQYRERLGGSFVDVHQLMEVDGFTQERFEKIRENVVVLEKDVKGFSLLKASREEMGRHPYIGPYAAKGIETYLRLKGRESFSSDVQLLDELVKEHVLSGQNADKLREYLLHL